ncbi:MAG TPA: metal-dependent hydrolase [Noviherbaspirillum sp.]|uniref:metal-dependent hydrolase n=1 Tax=Noviherbaspirillum sp. TaxID=1926288 RepID=UPI002D39B001|nr:metal-dependent hydrolase [Noviherbaspirillum sp.]HYD93707.1 metal-dependent hydrolase [Noviherbaspirillum sp.]
MFIGHFGIGFGAKAATPGISLGTLFLAAQFLDLLWPTLLLLGVETVRIAPGNGSLTPLVFEHYPFSHSLLAVLAWAAAAALLYGALRREWRGALLMALLVVSHWLLDAIVHQPDLPLYPGSATFVGLNLWASLPKTLAIELPLFGFGVWLYARSTRAQDAAGKWGFWSLVAFLLLIHAGNLFGEPPPSSDAIAWVGQAQWLLVLWGYWVDRHRRPAARG